MSQISQTVALGLVAALERLVESYGYVDYRSDEEKESDPDVMVARRVIAEARAVHCSSETMSAPLGDGSVEIFSNGLAGIIREYPNKADHARRLLDALHSGALKITVCGPVDPDW